MIKNMTGVAEMIIFARIGIAAVVGVICGATHHLLTAALCAIMFGVCYADRKQKINSTKQK